MLLLLLACAVALPACYAEELTPVWKPKRTGGFRAWCLGERSAGHTSVRG